MIYDQLLGDDDDTLSNVVEVHVSHIRKKLGKEFIQTRRGQGYMIAGEDDVVADASVLDGERESS
ncbi:MAG: helix-turn-helix domain-containing protein [Isosphaeraceae bacterium]